MARERLELISDDFGGACWRRVYMTGLPQMSASHTHDELEFNLILSGFGSYMVDGVRYDLVPGTMIFLYPQQEHLLVLESEGFEMWITVYRPAFLKKNFRSEYFAPLRRELPSGAFCKHLSPVAVEQLDGILAELTVSTGNADAHNAILAYSLAKAWDFFCNSAVAGLASKHISAKIAQAIKTIAKNADSETVEQLADAIDIEPSRLSRMFKKQMGLTITEYRQKVCLERFLAICRHNRKVNLAHAALQAGFGSYPQFHRVFKTHFKISPFEYLRKMR